MDIKFQFCRKVLFAVVMPTYLFFRRGPLREVEDNR